MERWAADGFQRPAVLCSTGLRSLRFESIFIGDDVTVPFPENFRSTLDADVEIRGSSREQLIGGIVNLRRAEYTEDIELADLIDTRRRIDRRGH